MAMICLGLVLAAIAFATGAQAGGAAAPAIAVVSIGSPSDVAGSYAGRFAQGAPMPTSAVELVAFVPPADAEGCTSYAGAASSLGDFLAVVGPRNCSLEQKLAQATAAGAKGIMVVSAREQVELDSGNASLGAGMVIGMPRSVGEAIAARSSAGGAEQPVRMSISVYSPPGLLDVSLLLLVCLATSLVVAGAFFSTADLRLGSPIAPKAEEVVEMGRCFPFAFCMMGSFVLVVLYFLMQYLIYLIIFMFCLGGTTQLTELLHKCLRYRFTILQRRLLTAPLLGPIEVSHFIAFPCAVSVSVLWVLYRNTAQGWIFQDIIGASFLCFIQRTLRMPNIKLAVALLSIMFVFDIFWVFISPVFFEKSVMVVVATGGGTGESVPMLLRVPAINDPLGRDRMLGFGDIALPGLLISFLRRHDLLSGRSLRRGYFAPAVVGYFVGMCAAFTALFMMRMGQPALLYLVPSTLAPTLVLACVRRELGALWRGTPCPSAEGAKASGSTCSYCPSGHALKPWVAEAGRCDGCGKPVQLGTQVMDCRQCNWYLCGACRPIAEACAGAAGQDLEAGASGEAPAAAEEKGKSKEAADLEERALPQAEIGAHGSADADRMGTAVAA